MGKKVERDFLNSLSFQLKDELNSAQYVKSLKTFQNSVLGKILIHKKSHYLSLLRSSQEHDIWLQLPFSLTGCGGQSEKGG